MKKYNSEINITLSNIFDCIKKLSDTTNRDDFINSFKQYSNTWKRLTGKGCKNSLSILKDLTLNEFIKVMTDIIIDNRMCPPINKLLHINIEPDIVNILKVYKSTINSNNPHVMTLGRLLIIIYFYFGVTDNTSTNTNCSVVNEYLESFMQMISEDSLTRQRINNNENINFIGLTSFLSNLEEKYNEYQKQDALATQIQFAKKITLKINKNKSKSKIKPYNTKQNKAKQKQKKENEAFTKQLGKICSRLIHSNDEKMDTNSELIPKDEKIDDAGWWNDYDLNENSTGNDVTMLDDDMHDNKINEFNELQNLLYKQYEDKDNHLIENDNIQNESKQIRLNGSDNLTQAIKENQVEDKIFTPQSYKNVVKNLAKDVKIENIDSNDDDDDNETIDYNNDDNETVDYNYDDNDDNETVDYNFNHNNTKTTTANHTYYKLTKSTRRRGPVATTNADSNKIRILY